MLKFLLLIASSICLALPAEAEASSSQPLSHPCQWNEDPWIEIVRTTHELRFWCGHRVHRSYPVALGRPGYRTLPGYYRVQYQKYYPTPLNAAVTDVFIWLYEDTRTGFWIGIHGTSLTDSIGTDDSLGCIRMLRADALEIASYTYADMVVWIRDTPWRFDTEG